MKIFRLVMIWNKKKGKMKIGHDKFDEEIITKVSNDDDNDFEASDDQKNSDDTQPTKMKPFNIDEDLSAIMKKNFIGKSNINSNFSRLIKKIQWMIFLEIFLGCMTFIQTLDLRYQTKKLRVYINILLI